MQTYPRSTAVFIDEFDTGALERAANGQVISYCERRLVVSYFCTENGISP
jgi:hypothetical protein